VARGPLRLFYSYAHEDDAPRRMLEEHLELLARRGVIVPWHDRTIVPGREWRAAIEENLRTADIVLLLVSQAFLASEFVREVEIPLAMQRHGEGSVRVIPVLLEPVGDLGAQPFAKLEVLPTKAHPVSEWDDPTRAFADVAEGVRRAATEIVWERGGPFEFGCHAFTEAELADLETDDRERARSGLERLSTLLTDAVPPRRPDGNLLLATWCLRQFGRRPNEAPESHFYIAQILSAFDLIAVQEVDRDLERFRRVLEILGPDWGHLISDVKPGPLGNNERVAVVYYTPRVEFLNVSGGVVLPNKQLIGGRQFARTPFSALFGAGPLQLNLVTAHLYWGRQPEDRLAEATALARHLSRRAKRENQNYVVAGDFCRGERDWDGLDVWREAEFVIPDSTLHPSNALGNKYYDVMGFRFDRNPVEFPQDGPRSGAVGFFDVVLRDTDEDLFRGLGASISSDRTSPNHYRLWRSFEISDHRPVWVELERDWFGDAKKRS
jgi:hypothetical protein